MFKRLRRKWYWYWHTGPVSIDRLDASWDRFWLCRIRNHHQVKFATAPRCYRCGKVV